MSFLDEALRMLEIAVGEENTVETTVQAAADALLANLPTSSGANPLVQAFQAAYRDAGHDLSVDGTWGPNTATALAQYGTLPSGWEGGSYPGGGQQVARVLTNVGFQPLADAIATVWPSVIGGEAPTRAIATLLAQSAFETGSWKACWNNNFGNVKHVAGDGCDWFTMSATEGDENVVMVKSTWRSYPTVQQGAAGYISFLHKHFPSAWAKALEGDTDGFVASLRASGYFTGNLEDYQRGVRGLWAKFRDVLPSVGTLETVGEVGVGIYALGAIGILGLALWTRYRS